MCFAGALCGIADAKPSQSVRIVPADVVIAALAADGSANLNSPTTFVSDDLSLNSQPLASVLSRPVRQRLVALAADGNMPSADADLAMWGGSHGSAGALEKRAPNDSISRFARGIINRTSSIARNLERSAVRFIGTPYVFGGTSPNGFDCSGYVQHVFAMLGISLPRTADAQYYAGRPTTGGMQMGDLVFFQTYAPGPSHVGIYLGGDKFISSSGHGVMISSLHEGYWAARYIGAKRVIAAR